MASKPSHATAWYIIRSDNYAVRWLNVLHWPYCLWHLSYPAIGAALAPDLNWPVLGWTILAFFLGMGIAAHCFDLIKGDPLRVGLRPVFLSIVGGLALGGAALIGVLHVTHEIISPWLLPLVCIGVLLAIGYNLEFPGFHGDWQFATWWAAFPMLVGYLAQDFQFHPVILGALLIAFISAMSQRILSTRARFLRREVRALGGYYTSDWGQCYEINKSWVLEPLDQTLIWLNAMMVLFALFMLLGRLIGGSF